MRIDALLVMSMLGVLGACGAKSGAGDDDGGSCTTSDQCSEATPVCSAEPAANVQIEFGCQSAIL